jgi:hypothetical protein
MADNPAQEQFYRAVRSNLAKAQGDAGAFPNADVQAVQGFEYSLSGDEQKAIKNAHWAASLMAQKIISDYQNVFGTITSQDIAAAQDTCGKFAVSNSQDYVVAYVLGYLWSGQKAVVRPPLTLAKMASAKNLESLLPSMPSSGSQVVTNVAIYLSILTRVNTVLSSQQMRAWILAPLQTSAPSPSPATAHMVGNISTTDRMKSSLGRVGIPSIKDNLECTSRAIELSLNTSQAQGSDLYISIDGGPPFEVVSWLKFKRKGGGTYDMSKLAGTSAVAAVTIRLAGYSVVPVSRDADAWQQENNPGWYSTEPVAQMVHNDEDPTGYMFGAQSPHDMKPCANGGTFGMLTGLFISSPPTITIIYANADYSEFQQSWSETDSGSLELFGMPLANPAESVYQGTCEQGSSNSTFTLTFGPTPEYIKKADVSKTAFVLGRVESPGSQVLGISAKRPCGSANLPRGGPCHFMSSRAVPKHAPHRSL